MSRPDEFGKRESGQTLVLIALGLIALLAFVALAIDGGNAYASRRQQQNAADAGALAGAYELCYGTPGNAQSVATTYAISHNGAETATVTVDMAAYTVHVIARETVETYFAGVVGIPTVNVAAEATAACGAANSSCGLWPIAFPKAMWQTLGTACGRTFYVWMDDQDDHGATPNNLDCDVCDCDTDDPNDGIPEIISDEGRAWLDFSDVVDPLYPGCAQSGCGASELKCWIREDSPGRVKIPSCIPGDNGEKQGTRLAVKDREGDIVRIPIFDGTGCGGTSSCPGGLTYNVVGFGCVQVVSWRKNPQIDLPYQDGTPHCWKGDLIEVKVSCDQACYSACGTTSGGGPPAPGVIKAVSLID